MDASQAAAAEAEALKAQRASYEASAQARARARLPTNLHQQVRGAGWLGRRRCWGAAAAALPACEHIPGWQPCLSPFPFNQPPTITTCIQVCPISGLIINNEESRLQDHYAGRNYK